MASDQIPDFDPSRLYLIRGATAQLIKNEIRKNRPCAVVGGGIQVVSQIKDGAFIRGVGAGMGGGTTTSGDELPDFQPNKIYFLREETLKAMFAAARSNHTKVVTGSGLSVPSDGPNGVVIASG